jgi:2-keto-4-pentenoate hydratase
MPLTQRPHWSGAIPAAQELLRQQQEGEVFTGLVEPLAPADVMQAYAAQDCLIDIQSQLRHTSVSGYKIAITTPVMREFVGFDDAISGCVLADMVFQSGHSVAAGKRQHLIIEFELALQFGRDVPERKAPWTADSILDFIACAYPCLEIADDRHAVYAELKRNFFSLVAENAWNHGAVLGVRIEKNQFPDLWQSTGTAYVDGQAIGSGHSRDVMGHPLEAMAWIANHFQQRGRRFKAGQWVTTGSWLASFFPLPGQHLRFDLAGCADVQVQIT